MNLHARYNLCFADASQTANFSNGIGTTISYEDLPILKGIRKKLPTLLGDKAKDLVCEANYYFDPTKCGVGFHGDSERTRVIGIRLGVSLPLHYQWLHNSKPIGKRARFVIHHGDFYVMGEKTVGTDWLKSKIPTLRHAAGAPKFLEIPMKK